MVLDFSELKNYSQNSLVDLASQLAKTNSSQFKEKDERFWRPTMDKAGNGFAVFRWLPSPKGEALPYAKIWRHAFQGPTGAWYIENSLTTKGLPDPVSEYNSRLWATGIESNKDIVRKQSRKLTFISNIFIVNDPQHPENNEKVFLYQYGKKIFTKLNNAMNPQFPGEIARNPFDPWTGPDFHLKVITTKDGPNYDESSFGDSGPIGSDDLIEQIWNQEYSLQTFLDPSNFKSYDALKERFDRVIGIAFKTDIPFDMPPKAAAISPATTPKASPPPWVDDDDDGENRIDFFRKLAGSSET